VVDKVLHILDNLGIQAEMLGRAAARNDEAVVAECSQIGISDRGMLATLRIVLLELDVIKGVVDGKVVACASVSPIDSATLMYP